MIAALQPRASADLFVERARGTILVLLRLGESIPAAELEVFVVETIALYGPLRDRWNQVLTVLDRGCAAHELRPVLESTHEMFLAWRDVARSVSEHVSRMGDSVGQHLPGVDELGKLLEVVKAAQADASDLLDAVTAPPPPIDPKRLAEADEAYARGEYTRHVVRPRDPRPGIRLRGR